MVGQRRLEALQVEAAQMPAPPVTSSIVSEMQEKMDTLVKERDALRSRPEQPVSKQSDMGDNLLFFREPSTNAECQRARVGWDGSATAIANSAMRWSSET